MKKYFAVIPAAGTSSRFFSAIDTSLQKSSKNNSKKYCSKLLVPIKMNEESIVETVLEKTLKVFLDCSCIEKIFMPINLQFKEEFLQVILKLNCLDKVILIAGGESRSESVYKGVQAVQEFCLNNLIEIEQQKECYVLVHDAARCFITKELILKVCSEVAEFKAVTLGISVVDTILKISSEKSIISEILKRDELKAMQTPQAFLLEIIAQAHQQQAEQVMLGSMLAEATCDASLVARTFPVKVIEGSIHNTKITYPSDVI